MLEKQSQEVFKKYEDIEQTQIQQRIKNLEKATKEINPSELTALYKEDELQEMACNHKMKLISVYGRSNQKAIKNQICQHYDKRMGLDDFWNDPVNRMYGFQDHEDLMNGLKSDNKQMEQ